MEPPDGFPVRDALEARETVFAFWDALATDEDARAWSLHVASLARANGFHAPSGIAARLRERMALTIDRCESMGGSDMLGVLASESWTFLYKPTRRMDLYDEPTLIEGWLIVVARDGGWTVACVGAPQEGNEVVTKIRLPFDPGPVAHA